MKGGGRNAFIQGCLRRNKKWADFTKPLSANCSLLSCVIQEKPCTHCVRACMCARVKRPPTTGVPPPLHSLRHSSVKHLDFTPWLIRSAQVFPQHSSIIDLLWSNQISGFPAWRGHLGRDLNKEGQASGSHGGSGGWIRWEWTAKVRNHSTPCSSDQNWSLDYTKPLDKTENDTPPGWLYVYNSFHDSDFYYIKKKNKSKCLIGCSWYGMVCNLSPKNSLKQYMNTKFKQQIYTFFHFQLQQKAINYQKRMHFILF